MKWDERPAGRAPTRPAAGRIWAGRPAGRPLSLEKYKRAAGLSECRPHSNCVSIPNSGHLRGSIWLDHVASGPASSWLFLFPSRLGGPASLWAVRCPLSAGRPPPSAFRPPPPEARYLWLLAQEIIFAPAGREIIQFCAPRSAPKADQDGRPAGRRPGGGGRKRVS